MQVNMREEEAHSRYVYAERSTQVMDKDSVALLGSSAPGDLPVPKCFPTTVILQETSVKQDSHTVKTCTTNSPKSSPTLEKKPFPAIRGLLQGVKTLFSPQKDTMKTSPTMETKYFVAPDALQLQLIPEYVKFFGKDGYQFFYPIFCGELMIRVWSRPEGNLYALEIFGEDGEPVLGPKSPYWNHVEHYDWSRKLPKAKMETVFTLDEVKGIIDDLYRAAPSSWRTTNSSTSLSAKS